MAPTITEYYRYLDHRYGDRAVSSPARVDASKLVFIGRDLDADELKAGFAACVA